MRRRRRAAAARRESRIVREGRLAPPAQPDPHPDWCPISPRSPFLVPRAEDYSVSRDRSVVILVCRNRRTYIPLFSFQARRSADRDREQSSLDIAEGNLSSPLRFSFFLFCLILVADVEEYTPTKTCPPTARTGPNTADPRRVGRKVLGSAARPQARAVAQRRAR